MIALIPAAGMATRLRPLTDNTPKCLLPIEGKCLLQRAIENLMAAGIQEVVLCTGYLEDQIKAFVAKTFPKLTVHFVTNTYYETTNNIYSLYLMRPWADAQDVVLLDSDILFDAEILKRLLANPDPNTLALSRHPLGEEEIKVIIDGQNRVTEISKVCSIEQALGESIGIEKMSAAYTKALYAEMEQMIEFEGQSGVFYERAFERLIPQGHLFTTTDVTDLFAVELDTVDDFTGASQAFKDKTTQQ